MNNWIIGALVFFGIVLFSCKTSTTTVTEAQLNQGLEKAKCYFSIIQDDSKKSEKAFVLELIAPKFEQVAVTYSDEQLKRFEIRKNEYRLLVKERHNRFVFQNENLSNFTRVEHPIGFVYCIAEIKAEYRNFSKADLMETGNTIFQQKMVSESKIFKRYVKKRPTELSEHQLYFEKGNWSELEEARWSSH